MYVFGPIVRWPLPIKMIILGGLPSSSQPNRNIVKVKAEFVTLSSLKWVITKYRVRSTKYQTNIQMLDEVTSPHWQDWNNYSLELRSLVEYICIKNTFLEELKPEAWCITTLNSIKILRINMSVRKFHELISFLEVLTFIIENIFFNSQKWVNSISRCENARDKLSASCQIPPNRIK